jgi:hypothetical protein
MKLSSADRKGPLPVYQSENPPARRKRRLAFKGAAVLMVAALGGLWVFSCATPPRRHDPVAQRTEGDRQILAFDMNRSGQPDYWEYAQGDGRVTAVAFADSCGQPGQPISLDAMDRASIPHFVILLDGVPFEVVVQARQAGLFRLFYAPSKVICCFPAMTDLALADVMHSERCQSLQALGFDRSANHTCGGNSAYLSAANAPWAAKVSFRASPWWDGLMYLDPQKVFDHELQEMGKCFAKFQTGEAYGYSVGTAGLGTRYGREGMAKYLAELDAFCQQIVYERRGRVRITLTADHGHGLVEDKLVSFKDVLKAGGYHESDSLCEPPDVVTVSYGLVTYAEFFTKDAAGVAKCLLNHEAVDFTCYPDGDKVVICDRDGAASVSQGPHGGFKYDHSQADPFKLGPILQRLAHAGKISPDGEIDEAALFEATVDHEYPDPLARVWRTFHGLVQNQPDVIANLRDGYCHGSQFFYDAIGGHVASTHGSMNRRSSTTFVMSMLGDLPPVLRSGEILPALAKLRQPAQLAGSK